MRYHVPFSQRQRPHAHRPGPIYIGFDQPVSIQRRRGRGRFNWFGFMGLLLVLISPLTLFLLAPVALLFSLIGMRRSPRGMATVGMVLALLGTTVLSLGIFGVASRQVAANRALENARMAVQIQKQVSATGATMELAIDELRAHRAANDFHLPDSLQGNIIAVQHTDAWKTELRYEPNSEGCVVRSAGPDQQFNTKDDITQKLDGKTNTDPYVGF